VAVITDGRYEKTYLIGDVHGCYASLMKLLETIQFNEHTDQLWFAGDLVNRGPQSLEVLRFVIGLKGAAKTVLGNHDLHLLACAWGGRSKAKDTFQDILQAPDREVLLDWLRQQPLVLHEPEYRWLLVHAGICPAWTLEETLSYAEELHQKLSAPTAAAEFIHQWYGNIPTKWHARLQSPERERVIINYFTRMRILDSQGQMELTFKQGKADIPRDYAPWFSHPHQLPKEYRIAFGHWASLMGETEHYPVMGLDTGCVWGQRLSAFRIQDEKFFQIKAQEPLSSRL
jgi:bis(5'-nucleosyl)-tetraphosphatase (symmetrical)